MSTKDEREAQLAAIDEKREEVRDRMPAHSVRPDMMNALIELEDQRDALLERIAIAEKRKR